MAAPVDMSLDDIIKKNRARGRGHGRARCGRGSGGSFNGGRMPGAVRKGHLSVNPRPAQYKIAKPPRKIRNLPWQHDLLEDSIRAAGITGVEVGTKLYISNLDYGVSNEDIRELFSEVGDLKRYAIHYDKTGRANGSAEVVYTRRIDAFAAVKKYNNIMLDGRPMKLEIMSAASEVPISARVNVSGVNGRRKRTVVMTPMKLEIMSAASEVPISARVNVTGVNGRRKRTVVMTAGQGRGRGVAPSNCGSGVDRRGGIRRGRGGGKKQPVDKSADELDKELDMYHADAMQS